MYRLGQTLGVALLVFVVVVAASILSAAPPATTQKDLGPDVVMLKELVSLYDPVPFDHKGHARMSDMWDGCVTCHHRPPDGSTRPATKPADPAHLTQAASAAIPACKECHAVAEPKAEIHMPSLKGAYHRQCLNCHREWSGANDCVICHRPRDTANPPTSEPTRDDIVGRMHPPLPAPQEKLYKVRFTPADGPNVLFRHENHVKAFGLKCSSCHVRDSCAHCHEPNGPKPEQKILKPHETWEESHGPCVRCHTTQARCRGCHYKDGQPAPPAFDHRRTGQALDADHAKLVCEQCHTTWRSKEQLTCGGVACHATKPAIAFPAERPGPQVTTQPFLRQPERRQGPTKGVLR